MITPPTSYILDSLRELYIKYSDPSKMARDPIAGLKEKEADLALLTHENLDLKIDDYVATEAMIAGTIKSSMTGLLLGTMSIDDLTALPPIATFSSFQLYNNDTGHTSPATTIQPNLYYLLDSEVSEGNMWVTLFDYEWSIIDSPTAGTINFHEIYDNANITEGTNIRNIGTRMKFTVAGFYILMLTLTLRAAPAIKVYARATATVV